MRTKESIMGYLCGVILGVAVIACSVALTMFRIRPISNSGELVPLIMGLPPAGQVFLVWGVLGALSTQGHLKGARTGVIAVICVQYLCLIGGILGCSDTSTWAQLFDRAFFIAVLPCAIAQGALIAVLAWTGRRRGVAQCTAVPEPAVRKLGTRIASLAVSLLRHLAIVVAAMVVVITAVSLEINSYRFLEAHVPLPACIRSGLGYVLITLYSKAPRLLGIAVIVSVVLLSVAIAMLLTAFLRRSQERRGSSAPN